MRELSVEELTERIKGFKRELLDFRMQKAEGKLSSSHRIRQVRRDAARGLTLLREKEK